MGPSMRCSRRRTVAAHGTGRPQPCGRIDAEPQVVQHLLRHIRDPFDDLDERAGADTLEAAQSKATAGYRRTAHHVDHSQGPEASIIQSLPSDSLVTNR
jgi:hypothetical protein